MGGTPAAVCALPFRILKQAARCVVFPDEHIQTLKDAANSSLQSEGDKVEKESAEMVRCPRRSESLWIDNYVARL